MTSTIYILMFGFGVNDGLVVGGFLGGKVCRVVVWRAIYILVGSRCMEVTKMV